MFMKKTGEPRMSRILYRFSHVVPVKAMRSDVKYSRGKSIPGTRRDAVQRSLVMRILRAEASWHWRQVSRDVFRRAEAAGDQPVETRAACLFSLCRQEAERVCPEKKVVRRLPARDLSLGDTVFTRHASKGELIPSTVTGIEKVIDYGIYAPFTWSGRLLVDDVLVPDAFSLSHVLVTAHIFL